MKNKPKCIVKNNIDKKSCNYEVVAKLKVRLYHPDSDKTSTQIWYLCEKHLHLFISTEGKGWYRWYKKKESIAPVIYYNIISLSEFISTKSIRLIERLTENFMMNSFL